MFCPPLYDLNISRTNLTHFCPPLCVLNISQTISHLLSAVICFLENGGQFYFDFVRHFEIVEFSGQKGQLLPAPPAQSKSLFKRDLNRPFHRRRFDFASARLIWRCHKHGSLLPPLAALRRPCPRLRRKANHYFLQAKEKTTYWWFSSCPEKEGFEPSRRSPDLHP